MRRRVRSLVMMGRARKSGASSPLLRAAETTFHPQDVAEVSNGYFWDPYADAIGLGTVDFRVREGNGHSTFDLIQATVANQPTVLAENGGTQFRMGKAGSANPAFLATAAVVQAGWTGATYLGMWLRLPDALGIITSSTTTYFQHSLTTGNQRRLILGSNNSATNSLDRLLVVASVDGISNGTNTNFDTPFDGGVGPSAAADWVWVEQVIDPVLLLGGSVTADKVKLFFNFVQQTQTVAPTVDFTGLFDGAALIKVASGSTNGTANSDTTDWAACYYANGIPSLANRVRLANHRNPTGVAFA